MTSGEGEAQTVGELLARAVRDHPAHQVLVVGHERTTYAELDAMSATLARQLLASGVGKGTRVGLLFPNGRRFIVTWMAAARIGAVAVPLSTFSTAAELLRTVRHADLHLVISADQFLQHNYLDRWKEALPALRSGGPQLMPEAPYLRGIWVWAAEGVPAWATAVDFASAEVAPMEVLSAAEHEVHPADPVSIIYTSGSTSDPKGVVHSHGNFVRQARRQAAAQSWVPSDRVFSPMPFFWVGGLVVIFLAATYVGATILAAHETHPADVLAFLETERATHYLGWAHGARALADDPTFASRDLTAMRGGVLYEAMPVAARPVDRTLLGEALGMTETAGPHLFGHLQPVAEQFRGTFGQLAPGFEHRVVDVVTRSVVVDGTVGELQLRGDTLMIAMQKKEFRDCVDADGWFSTGDLVHMRDGHVFFHGRADDAIKSRGSNVSPREVEAALLSIPGVATAFVTGVVDDQGETVVGAVVTPEHEVDLVEDEIRNQARKTLSSYKVPRIVLLIAGSELPMAASSKVDRRALVARLQAAALSRDWRT